MFLALGDWTDKAEAGQSTARRYAASKYTLSVRAKHTILSCAQDLQGYKPWDELPLKCFRSAQMWRADGVSVLRLRTVSQRERAKHVDKMLPVTMPDSINGRVMASTLCNGVALCPAWQSAKCRRENCSLAHLCAVVLTSGCVCGGRRAARECRDKRRLTTVKGAEAFNPAEPGAKARLNLCHHHRRVWGRLRRRRVAAVAEKEAGSSAEEIKNSWRGRPWCIPRLPGDAFS